MFLISSYTFRHFRRTQNDVFFTTDHHPDFRPNKSVIIRSSLLCFTSFEILDDISNSNCLFKLIFFPESR